jgi:hypothetical protein
MVYGPPLTPALRHENYAAVVAARQARVAARNTAKQLAGVMSAADAKAKHAATTARRKAVVEARRTVKTAAIAAKLSDKAAVMVARFRAANGGLAGHDDATVLAAAELFAAKVAAAYPGGLRLHKLNQPVGAFAPITPPTPPSQQKTLAQRLEQFYAERAAFRVANPALCKGRDNAFVREAMRNARGIPLGRQSKAAPYGGVPVAKIISSGSQIAIGKPLPKKSKGGKRFNNYNDYERGLQKVAHANYVRAQRESMSD